MNIIPSFVRQCLVSREGNALVVNSRVVDPDAQFILDNTDEKTNDWIGKFGRTYVVDVM